MVHEFTHVAARSHNEDFTMAESALHSKLAEDGTDIHMRTMFGRILKKNQGLFNELRDKFNESTTQNTAQSIHKGDGNTGTASRMDANGTFGSFEAGDAVESGNVQQRRAYEGRGELPENAGRGESSGERGTTEGLGGQAVDLTGNAARPCI